MADRGASEYQVSIRVARARELLDLSVPVLAACAVGSNPWLVSKIGPVIYLVPAGIVSAGLRAAQSFTSLVKTLLLHSVEQLQESKAHRDRNAYLLHRFREF